MSTSTAFRFNVYSSGRYWAIDDRTGGPTCWFDSEPHARRVLAIFTQLADGAIICPHCSSEDVATHGNEDAMKFEFCESCGKDADGYVEESDPRDDEEWRTERQAEYDEHDPGQSFAEESRRAHEAQF